LIFEGKVTVTPGELDTKQLTVKSNRSGIGFRGDDMYLVVATGATVIDLGNIMNALGMQYATNLDGGGSSALIFEGQYKIGPGRNLPNALVIGE
jgi:exopolysaccharide biosynthesis protein